MSRSRQLTLGDVRSFSISYASGYTWRRRASDWDQLVFSLQGMLTITIGAGLWVVPPHQALWVPADNRHDIHVAGNVALRAVYFRPGLSRTLPRECRLITLGPLLLELLRRTLRLEVLDRKDPSHKRLLALLIDELAESPRGSIDLPTPRDPRASRAAAAVRDLPAARHPLAQIAKRSGASERTLERLFRAETGMGFGAWRQRARMVRAVQLLAEGMPVTRIAARVGFQSPSAFVAAFRRTLGSTPARYLREDHRATEGRVRSPG